MRPGTTLKGIGLALTTAVFWGALPVALKQLVTAMDPLTIVWLRFSVSAAWLWLWPGGDPRRPSRWPGSGRMFLLFGIAVLGLGGNFVLFNCSVAYLSPAASQIIGQTGPMLLMLGSVFVLGEPLRRIQVAGVLTLIAGLLLFFNEQLDEVFRFRGEYAFGLVLGGAGALVWAIYGLAQKILLREIAPPRIMRVLYTCCALALLPFASPGTVPRLDPLQLFCLAFCCVNTLIAYGAFTRAMSCWHTAKVSAIITMTPLFALLFSKALHLIRPEAFPADPLNWLGYGGAAAVVAGAALIAVGPLLHLRPPALLHHRQY